MQESRNQYLAELLQQVQEGDKVALNTLCKEVESILRNYFGSKFQDRTIVDDLAQEAYIRLFHALQNVTEPMKFRSFVTKVAIHVSQDYLRTRYRSLEVPMGLKSDEDDDNPSEYEIATDSEVLDERIIEDIDLKNALNKLDDQAQQILLKKMDGYKYEEIAEEVGLSVSGVKMQVRRSLNFLRSSLFFVTFLGFITTILIEVKG